MPFWQFYQKLADWLDWPCPVIAALQNGPQDFLFLFYISIFIYFFKYETIVRSSVFSFGHSDPDPGSVLFNPFRPSFPIITRLHDFLNWCNLYCDLNRIPIHKVLPASLHQPVTKYQMRIDQFGHLLFKRNIIWKEKGQPNLLPFEIVTLKKVNKQNGKFTIGIRSPTDVTKWTHIFKFSMLSKIGSLENIPNLKILVV